MAKTITDFHTEVSSWTRDELINALWAYVQDNKNHAWLRIQEAQDFILGADPDDPDNLTRISEILGSTAPDVKPFMSANDEEDDYLELFIALLSTPAMDKNGVVTHPVTGVKIYPGR